MDSRMPNKVTLLLQAIAADLAGASDVEGRSELDFLIAEIQPSSPALHRQWSNAVAQIIRDTSTYPEGWWVAVERLVVLADLQTPELGSLIENVLTEVTHITAVDRSSIYAL